VLVSFVKEKRLSDERYSMVIEISREDRVTSFAKWEPYCCCPGWPHVERILFRSASIQAHLVRRHRDGTAKALLGLLCARLANTLPLGDNITIGPSVRTKWAHGLVFFVAALA
jgi:hypothetical protein